jgi:hypothetical protein
MTSDQIVALAFLGAAALALAAWCLRIAADERANRRDIERLRAVDREWAAAVARWLESPLR